MEKEYLYVGHYIDTEGNYILKVGTTNDLDRRRAEHNRNYKRAKHCTMPKENEFVYDWYLPLSKYNTLRYEDRNRQAWADMGIGEFIRNDRFNCGTKPLTVQVTVRKTYIVSL
jgi:predicted GIY-YIG superfamily endonuclease